MRLCLVLSLLLLLPVYVDATAIVNQDPQNLIVESGVSAGAIFDLGQDVRRGVEAHVQLKLQPLIDSSEPLEKEKRHFLILVSFVENDSGTILLKGQVAARSFDSDSQRMDTVRLKPQADNNWTGTLVLPKDGETMIKIGSKLADGKKRIYRFFHRKRVEPVDKNKINASE